MKTKIPNISKTLRNMLEKYKGRILKMPCAKDTSSMVDCIDYLLESGVGSNEQTTNFKQSQFC